MLGDVGFLIGQMLSFVAVIAGFISFQMKSPKGLLIFQIITSLAFASHYFLIGALTATGLNLLGVVQCACYYVREKRQIKSRAIPTLFTALIILTSILTWEGWYSAFIMAGLVVNSISFSLPNVQTIRKLNLIKSPLCLTYNAIVFSTGGVIFEIAILISSVIGLIRGKKSTKKV